MCTAFRRKYFFLNIRVTIYCVFTIVNQVLIINYNYVLWAFDDKITGAISNRTNLVYDLF